MARARCASVPSVRLLLLGVEGGHGRKRRVSSSYVAGATRVVVLREVREAGRWTRRWAKQQRRSGGVGIV